MPIPKQLLDHAPRPKPVAADEWNVFLSYRSVNRAWVLSLYDVLTELGHKVFLDQYVLKAGDKLVSKLDDALEKSQAGILIWSEATRDSVWVNDEYNTLQRKANEEEDFIFVPVRLDNTKLPGFAANRIYVDFITYPDGPNGGELLRLLYAIEGMQLDPATVRFANDLNETSVAAAAQVQAAITQGRAEKLVQLFKDGGLPWKISAALGCKAAEGLIKLRKNTEAITMLEQLEQDFRKALRPRQLKALALARRGEEGDLDKAQDILGEMHALNHLDPETMGIYGRTWMDRYAKSNDINDLEQSRDLYAAAFEKAPDDYYTGINAAAKSVMIGTDEDLEKAMNYAARVEKVTGTNEVPGDYWKTATIGELFLIQKKYKEAGDMYKKAVAMARAEKGNHESTFTQAKRLMEKLKPTDEERGKVAEAFKHLIG
jgi:tetratricopeptide (TPR) repeat protein